MATQNIYISNRKADVVFPLSGPQIPLDHRYSLFSAISQIIPAVHGNPDVGIFSIIGHRMDDTLMLDDRSHLRLRLPMELVRAASRLAGKRLNIDGRSVRVGLSAICPLRPFIKLRSDFVYINLSSQTSGQPVSMEAFMLSACQKLAEVCPSGQPAVIPSARVMKIKHAATLIGFPVEVSGISEDDSLRLLENGIGGKRSMGCGLFYPATR